LHLHLNFSGGLTGDMFIAAVLDAFPRFEQRVIAVIDALDEPYPVACSLVAHSAYELTGHRFEIEPFDKYFGHIPLAFPQEPMRWASVRERLIAAEIGPEVRVHTTKIFELIVRAEAAVRGVLPETVAFAAGAWNTLAQVVGAATLIDALDTAQWSASSFPSGGAVTLTGAAIVDYLCPPDARGRDMPEDRTLLRSGVGFGSAMTLNNYLHVLCFESGDAAYPASGEMPLPRRAAGRQDQQSRP
jgi:hypothetical protein